MRNLLINFSILLVIGGLATWLVMFFYQSEDNSPCASDHFLGKCYYIPHPVCMQQYENLKSECKQQIDALNLPPGRLTGPIADRCLEVKYDRAFRFSRKQTDECESKRKELEAWHQTNPDF